MTTPRESRAFVATELAGHCDRAVETAQLLVSELVANAIRHAGADSVEVTVATVDDHAVLAVFDSSPEQPLVRQVDADTIGGRGMLLVERLAHRWGVDPAGNGKNVWVELPCEGHDA